MPIRDDGQRFEGSRRESLRPHRDLGALDGLGELGTGKDLPAASLLHQLDPMAIDVVVLAQLVERRRDGGRTRLNVQRRQRFHGNGARSGEEGGFKQLR